MIPQRLPHKRLTKIASFSLLKSESKLDAGRENACDKHADSSK